MATRSLITWYAFTFKEQNLPPKDSNGFDIEHIYARERYNKEKSPMDVDRLEELGNKILLEKNINISASDYRFEDKKKYYSGFRDAKGKERPGSIIVEYQELTEKADFKEEDINERDRKIHDRFIQFLRDENLLKK